MKTLRGINKIISLLKEKDLKFVYRIYEFDSNNTIKSTFGSVDDILNIALLGNAHKPKKVYAFEKSENEIIVVTQFTSKYYERYLFSKYLPIT